MLLLGLAGSAGRLYFSSGDSTRSARDAALSGRGSEQPRPRLPMPYDLVRDAPARARAPLEKPLQLGESSPLRSVRLEVVPAPPERPATPSSSVQPFQAGGRLEAFPDSRMKPYSLDGDFLENEPPAPAASEPAPTPRRELPARRLVVETREPETTRPSQPPRARYEPPARDRANPWKLRRFKNSPAKRARPRVDPRYACLFGPDDGEAPEQKCVSPD